MTLPMEIRPPAEPKKAEPAHPGEILPAGVSEKLRITGLDFFYGKSQALYNISLSVPTNHVTAFIGPSGCGKSTFLRTLNRMSDTVRNTSVTGEVLLDGEDIFSLDVTALRRRV